jgi:hypothetical protein
MTIITKNNNRKNDSTWARHRSVWKGKTNVLGDVLNNLKAAPAKYKTYRGTPADVRIMWLSAFGAELPAYMSHTFTGPKRFKGTSGVDTWLGARSPFTDDVKVIWEDFARIFAQRSNDGTREGVPAGTTSETLFMSRTDHNFDLIYSKWGDARGKHWFFHWTSVVASQPVNRATIDVGSDDEEDESTDND